MIEERKIIRRSFDGCGVVVLRNRAANQDTRATRELRERGIENLAAHIVEINIDALRAVLLQRLTDVFCLVINSRVESKFLDDEFALRRTTSNADHATTF